MNKPIIPALLVTGAIALTISHASAQPMSDDLPAVPAETVEGAIDQAEPSDAPEASTSEQETAGTAEDSQGSMRERMAEQAEELTNEQVSVPVTPGVNEIIPIARNHLNRVLVPFADPRVRTTSSADYEIHKEAIYVATDSQGPVTMYVTNGSDESTAISLTLVPRQIAPVEVSLSLEGREQQTMVHGSQEDAGEWETSQPYVDTLRNLLREVALGQVPQGYSLADTTQTSAFAGCDQPGLAFDFESGQVLTGQKFRVHVGTVSNVADEPVEFVENNCGAADVAAVAAWPHTRLAPEQTTEVYVVYRQQSAAEQDDSTARPRLIEE